MSTFASSFGRIRFDKSILLICDIQERFRPLIFRSETIIRKSVLLSKVSQILNVPRIATEQYVKAFGRTVPDFDIGTENNTVHVFEKRQFSMITDDVKSVFRGLAERNQVILCGIEAHVCVYQTAVDLKEMGYEVFLACDAVSSQVAYDRTVALHQLSAAGCRISTTESLIFQLLGSADHPHFRTISGLIKDDSKQLNEFATDLSC